MNFNAPTMPLGVNTTWEARGYSGAGNVAPLIGSLQGRAAIVCGNAAGVFDELANVLRKVDNPVIFAVNDVGMYLPEVDHWVSLHGSNMAAWKTVRWLHPAGYRLTKLHAYDAAPMIDYNWSLLSPLMTLSGYFAAQLAYIMDASSIILCGCPGMAGRRFFEQRARGDCEYGGGPNEFGIRQQFLDEMTRLPTFRERMRSMSGWTRQILGGL